jgi:hypothetical protein
MEDDITGLRVLKDAFRNTGDEPMRILWIYSSSHVTRTFKGSTEEVEHLSAWGLMG